MGSKSRHVKEILPIILSKRKSPNQAYVEPFVGGANVIEHVKGVRIAGDAHPELIAMLKALQKGWIPPSHVSEDDYTLIKQFPRNYPIELVGFVGFGCSFSGKWWGGYARGNSSNGKPRNYCNESKRNVLKQAPTLKGIKFYNLPYYELPLYPNSIIYCDPPYANTTKYKSGDFNHDKFWQWCRNKVAEGHLVYVSEYNAPKDFICVWEKKVNSSLTQNTGSKKAVEKLFTIENKNTL